MIITAQQVRALFELCDAGIVEVEEQSGGTIRAKRPDGLTVLIERQYGDMTLIGGSITAFQNLRVVPQDQALAMQPPEPSVEEELSSPPLVEVSFLWDNRFGECYDCGRPAAYTSDEHQQSPENLRCSVCAAYEAAHGATITYLFPEDSASEAQQV